MTRRQSYRRWTERMKRLAWAQAERIASKRGCDVHAIREDRRLPVMFRAAQTFEIAVGMELRVQHLRGRALFEDPRPRWSGAVTSGLFVEVQRP